MTFDQCVDAYLNAHNESWSNPKHRQQWRNTLTSYAGPVIGALNVAHIETGHVLKVLEPIWKTKTETASRLRGRMKVGLVLGDDPRLPHRRESGAMERPLAKPARHAVEDCQGRTPCGASLSRAWRIHG
jgi:hypothetical protein